MTVSWEPFEVELNGGDVSEEPMGTKEKFWVPGTDGTEWLFKFARTSNGETRNEDWAEWIVHELALLIGIPSAVVLPAVLAGRRGIVSRNVVTAGARLVHGNELLSRSDPEYDLTAGRENPRYTVAAVRAALRGVTAPLGFDGLPAMSGFDAWSAYLLLDAWVAGRDRHHENWAVIEQAGTRSLSPSFDHGNALGFQVRDSQAFALVNDSTALTRWAERGKSQHFAGKPSLVQLANEALAMAEADVAAYWHNKLQQVSSDSIAAVVSAVPRNLMSEVSHNFVISLLELNRRRLSDGS